MDPPGSKPASRALAHHSLRAPQRADALRSALRAGPASTTSATTAPAESSPARATGSTESSGSALSRDRITAISKCHLRFRAARPAVSWVRESTRRSLAHRNCADHLHGIRRCGLPELPAGFGNNLIFRSGFGGILSLTV